MKRITSIFETLSGGTGSELYNAVEQAISRASGGSFEPPVVRIIGKTPKGEDNEVVAAATKTANGVDCLISGSDEVYISGVELRSTKTNRVFRLEMIKSVSVAVGGNRTTIFYEPDTKEIKAANPAAKKKAAAKAKKKAAKEKEVPVVDGERVVAPEPIADPSGSDKEEPVVEPDGKTGGEEDDFEL